MRFRPWHHFDSGDDSIIAPTGFSVINALGGNDTVTFGFKLAEATISHAGNRVIIDTASSHSVITGAERFIFTDGTVDNDDGNRPRLTMFSICSQHAPAESRSGGRGHRR